MTYIEFFDKNSAENIAAALIRLPKRIVLIGDKLSLLEKHAERYHALFAARGQEVEILCRSMDRNNMIDIVAKLSEIVETYENCVFDLTGGDELFLTSVGIVSERYKDKHIQIQRINLKNNAVTDCDNDHCTISDSDSPYLTVNENISIYGGDIVYQVSSKGYTYRWNYTDVFRKQIESLWDICNRNTKLWNLEIMILSAAEKFRNPKEQNPLKTTAQIEKIKEYLDSRSYAKYSYCEEFFFELYMKSFLREFKNDGKTITVEYRDEQIKRCLTTAGTILELTVFAISKELVIKPKKNRPPVPLFTDVMNGVVIDWDGTIMGEESVGDTRNEIDIMAMRGLIPVFISCKNGYIEMEELYKLKAVSERFGGDYAVSVLVATSLEDGDPHSEYIIQRASDMKIRLVRIERTTTLSDLETKIKNAVV
ncbi:MAG: DUF1887 family protein [Clostridia bacterium]|nr:DUF1887 family protein [Clostridia bacterium]